MCSQEQLNRLNFGGVRWVDVLRMQGTAYFTGIRPEDNGQFQLMLGTPYFNR